MKDTPDVPNYSHLLFVFVSLSRLCPTYHFCWLLTIISETSGLVHRCRQIGRRHWSTASAKQEDTTRGHSCVNTVTTWILERTPERHMQEHSWTREARNCSPHTGRTGVRQTKERGDFNDWVKKSRLGLRWPFLRWCLAKYRQHTSLNTFWSTF